MINNRYTYYICNIYVQYKHAIEMYLLSIMQQSVTKHFHTLD